MVGERDVLVAVVLLSNLLIVVGTIAFGWSASTVTFLFVVEALLGIVRMCIERLFAGRPRGDEVPPAGPYPVIYALFEHLWDKRGAIHIADWMPALYPRNLPFVLGQWIFGIPLGALFVVTWFFVPPSGGGLDGSLVLILPVFVAKHGLIIATWSATGVYETASAPTVRRHREFLCTVLIACVAVFVIAPQPADLVATAAIIAVLPKLLFDLREAGIGPDRLVFDPSSDTTEQPVSTPAGEPCHVFRTNRRAVSRWGVLNESFATAFVCFCLIYIFVLVGFLFESLVIVLAGIGLTILIGLSMTFVVMWLAHANAEYRIYADTLVAYDRYLDEPQWVVQFEDIQSISTNETVPLLSTPSFVTFRAAIELTTDEHRSLEYLERPEAFVRIVRGRMAGR